MVCVISVMCDCIMQMVSSPASAKTFPARRSAARAASRV